MKVKLYTILDRAVEEGAAYGVARAHKHTDEPEPEAIVNEVVSAIMSQICDVIDFEDEL